MRGNAFPRPSKAELAPKSGPQPLTGQALTPRAPHLSWGGKGEGSAVQEERTDFEFGESRATTPAVGPISDLRLLAPSYGEG
jgi:hypothetical protein